MNISLFKSSLISALTLISFAAQAIPAATALQVLEQRTGGRIGVVAIDVRTGRRLEYRSDERFLMCSTFKLPLVAHVLKRIDSGKEKMDRLIPFSTKDLLEYAPVTSKRVAEKQMTIKDLSVAVLQYSDNTAANLLLQTQGGPTALTGFLRDIGDKKTRLDRFEPELNTPKGDLDTTTPLAMAETVKTLVLGNTLSPTSKDLFKKWLASNAVSDARFRAGVPLGWSVADKGGSGHSGVTNDIGVLFHPKGKPIILTAFTSGSSKSRKEIEAALAEVARIATTEFGE